MPSCNPPSLKPLWQIMQAGHDCKLFEAMSVKVTWWPDLKWPGVKNFTHSPKLMCKKAMQRSRRYAQRFLVMRKKRERVVTYTLPLPLGRRFTTEVKQRRCQRYDAKIIGWTRNCLNICPAHCPGGNFVIITWNNQQKCVGCWFKYIVQT